MEERLAGGRIVRCLFVVVTQVASSRQGSRPDAKAKRRQTHRSRQRNSMLQANMSPCLIGKGPAVSNYVRADCLFRETASFFKNPIAVSMLRRSVLL